MTAHKVDSPSTDSSSDSRSGETLDIIARETGIDRSLLLPDATIEALGVASLDLTLALFELESILISKYLLWPSVRAMAPPSGGACPTRQGARPSRPRCQTPSPSAG